MLLRTVFLSLFFIVARANITIPVGEAAIKICGEALRQLRINERCRQHVMFLHIDCVPGISEHAVGFHLYSNNLPERKVKVNKRISVETDSDDHASQCHSGWVCFDGVPVGECPKTFFPSSWSWSDLEREVSVRVQNALKCGNYCLRSFGDDNGGKKFKCSLDVFAPDMTIRLVFTFYIDGSGVGLVNTLYPLIANIAQDESMASDLSEAGRDSVTPFSENGLNLTPSPRINSELSFDDLNRITPPMSRAGSSFMLRPINPMMVIRCGDLDQLERRLSQGTLTQAELGELLFLAIDFPNSAAINLLKEYGARIDSVNGVGDTSLIAALKNRCPKDVIAELLPFSDLGKPNATGKTAREYVSECAGTIKDLFVEEERRRHEIVTKNGWNDLIYNIMNGHTYSAKQEIEAATCEPNSPIEPNALRPLMAAAYAGNCELAELLLSQGADPRMRAKDGSTAITYASAAGKERLRAMLEKRALDLEEQEAHIWAQFQKSVVNGGALDEETLRFVRDYQDVPVPGTTLVPFLYVIHYKSIAAFSQLLAGATEQEIRVAWDCCLCANDPALLAEVCAHIKSITLPEDSDRTKQTFSLAIATGNAPILQAMLRVCADIDILEFAAKCLQAK